MAVSHVSRDEPRKAPKPEPIGNFVFLVLFTTCTMCALFLAWRRASQLRTVVAHRLKEWTGAEGGIRLSTDDGPPSREFLDEGDDIDDQDAVDDEPLPAHSSLKNQRNIIPSPTSIAHASDRTPQPPPSS